MQNPYLFYRLGVVILVTLYALTGCTSPAPPAGTIPAGQTATAQPDSTVALTPLTDSTGTLENTSWQLVSGGAPGAETAVIAGSTITLEFGAAGDAGGSGGCNTYGGSYQIQGDQLHFGEITSTLLACVDQAVTQQEIEYLAALQTAGRFEHRDGVLIIWYDDEQGVLNFSAAEPDAPLNATPVITPANTLTSTAMGTTAAWLPLLYPSH